MIKVDLEPIESRKESLEKENRIRDYYQDQSIRSAFEVEKKHYKTLAGEERAQHAVVSERMSLSN
jgi:hypothetical protein